MFRRVLILLYIFHCSCAVGVEDEMCSQNNTLLELPGDVVISVLLDVHAGPNCNVSLSKGNQEVATALYVVQMLNKFDFVPGIVLGLKIFDTCHDKLSLYKQALTATVELDCEDRHEVGILAPAVYRDILLPLESSSISSISTFQDQNLTVPLINILVHFLTTRYEAVDVLYSGRTSETDMFMDASMTAGICVKEHSESKLIIADDQQRTIVVAIGSYDELRVWLDKEIEVQNEQKVWIVVPTDNSDPDDLLPVGSYVIKPEPFAFDLFDEFLYSDDFVETAGRLVIHSPYLLGIGKTIVETSQILQQPSDSCSEGSNCAPERIDFKKRKLISNSAVYETLQVLPARQTIKFSVMVKMNEGSLLEAASYKIDPTTLAVTPENEPTKVAQLCLDDQVKRCFECLNFQPREDRNEYEFTEKHTLRHLAWVPIYLTISVCGTLACLVILAFVAYRYFVAKLSDGNPALSVALILSTVFMMQAIVPFCLEDDVMGAEHLNARKIFVATLSIGLAFSILLSRALFLACSAETVFTTHINAFIQGLMFVFMFGVQISISTMYFALSTDKSYEVIRSLKFVGLLAYDIFLLTLLAVICSFIVQIQRNCREDRYFFITMLGLSIIWTVWITTFLFVKPEERDIVVCFGILGTAYTIIFGMLVPQAYYMLTHLDMQRDISQKFEVSDYGPDPRMNTIARQALDDQSRQSFYDYGGPDAGNLQSGRFPNYYGSASPNARHVQRQSLEPQGTPGYNNYGFHPEMAEVGNAYVIPRVYVENKDGRKTPTDTNAAYEDMKPRKHKFVVKESDCIETEVYVEGKIRRGTKNPNECYPSRSPSPKLGQTEATICEEDTKECTLRVTRF